MLEDTYIYLCVKFFWLLFCIPSARKAKMDYLTSLLLCFIARPILTASIAIRQPLEACVTQALLGPDATQRIVTPQDETYTDARLGEKIQ